ncbi:MAG: DUF2157 domain-containing protein, partial [Acidimicrobiales bacterium]
STPPDGRRAGAAWVAATGAFLLIAAATVFIAVRWDEVPEAAKLALVGALTGAFLAGGRALRRTLPATGDVLFHLGAFLVPVDVAGLCLRLDLGWRTVVLTEGAVGAVVLGALAVAGGSVVMAWGAAASVMVLAGGVAAVTPLPAPLLLAAAAVVASLHQRPPLAVAGAAAAGLAPVTGALVTTALLNANGPGPGVLEELGLGGRAAALAAIVSSAIAAVVIGREAVRRHDLSLVALAGVCLTTGAATTWVNASPPREVSFLAGPALFLLVQAVTMLSQRDPFWGRPARVFALCTEVFAALVAAPLALAFVLVAPFTDEGFDLFSDGPGWTPEPAAGVAWALLAVGWLLASWRRQDPQPSPLAALCSAVANPRTVAFLTTSAAAALVVGTGSTIATAVGLLVMAVGLVVAGGNLAQPSRVAAAAAATVAGAACALWAPFVVAVSYPLGSLPVALGGAAVLGLAALPWASAARGWVSAHLATAGSLLAFCGCAIAREEIGLVAAMLTAVTAAWALAYLVERVSPLAANVVRASMAAGVVGTLGGSFTEIAAVATAATLLFALDAARNDEPLIAIGAGLGATLMIGAACGVSGLDAAISGLVLCSSAAVFAGLALVYPERWRPPFLAGAAAALTAGLPLAAADPARLAECLLVVGGLGVLAGVLTRNGILGHAGGGVALVGLGLHLTLDGVTASEAFVAPVALQLLVAGWQLCRRADPPSSWVAFGPAIALLGAAALGERLGGGEAWHSLVAGAVGVAAVAAGGWRRLAGPLFLGTGLVVAVTVLESLNTLAGIPTWAWLAVGGTTLLATGIALERSATTPVEAGRRLVDVVEERFS